MVGDGLEGGEEWEGGEGWEGKEEGSEMGTFRYTDSCPSLSLPLFLLCFSILSSSFLFLLSLPSLFPSLPHRSWIFRTTPIL